MEKISSSIEALATGVALPQYAVMACGFRTSSLKLSKNIGPVNLVESIGQSTSVGPIVKSIMEDLVIRGIDQVPRVISQAGGWSLHAILHFRTLPKLRVQLVQRFKQQPVTFLTFRMEAGFRIILAGGLADIIRNHYTGRKLTFGIARSAKNVKASFLLSLPLAAVRARALVQILDRNFNSDIRLRYPGGSPLSGLQQPPPTIADSPPEAGSYCPDPHPHFHCEPVQ